METALQQQLVAAQFERACDLRAVFVEGGDVGALLLVGLAVEVAKAAARDADVGDVHVAVDLPRHHAGVGHHASAHLVGCACQQGQRRLVVEPVGLLARERLAAAAFVQYVFHLRFVLRS